jgi:serine/threonine-protein kinase RsbW
VKKSVIKIPSDTGEIRKVSCRIIEDVGPREKIESKVFDIRLCTEEAVRNAIVHGNKNDPAKSVTVAYWIDGGNLHIEVSDEGSGFDYRNLPNPTAKENIMKNSGRGVYLIRRLMNKVEFNETGNVIRMTKHL